MQKRRLILLNEWNEARENQILKRSKWILTIKILRIFIIIVFCYLMYMLAITIISDTRGTKYEDAYYVKVATSMKNPNVYMVDSWLQDDSINAIGTRNFSSYMVKRVGKEESLIGEVNVSKKFLTSFSSIQYELPNRSDLNDFFFTLPNEEMKNANTEDDYSQSIWQRLEKLPEGTVSEFKFTTNTLMSPEELLEKLQPYDLDVLWMPLLTGEFESFTPNAYGGSVQEVNILDKIGLYGGHSHGSENDKKDFRSGSFSSTLQLDTIEQSKQFLLTNMEELLEKKESYREMFLGISYLEERYHFIQTNGFQVYGAVVTGPTKELLKLREEKGIHEVQLGDVELWNWD